MIRTPYARRRPRRTVTLALAPLGRARLSLRLALPSSLARSSLAPQSRASHRRTVTLALALAFVAPLAACIPNPSSSAGDPTATPTQTASATATPEPTPTPTPTMDATPLGPLGGTWEGTWVNTTPTAAIGTFRLVWAQQGDQLFGALTVVGSNCLSAGNVTGEIVGKGLSFGAVEGDTTIQYTGTIVDDDTIEGTYESDCGDSAGTWTATRTNT